nr:ABC transporter substrate-binding protein [uncultured Agathobaculum sp.]
MKKNGIFSRVLSGVLAGTLALSLSACGSSSSADSSAADGASDSGTTHLRLIYSPSLCAAPMYIAIENGYFEDEGLDVEQVTVDAAHVSEAIGADQVDVGMGLIGKLLQPLENGLPIKFTTGLHTGCTKLLVPGDSDIKSITDLKGKKIGVPGLADAATVVSKRSLSAAGIGVTEQNMEVEFSVYSRNDLPQALENGAVDAIALGDPTASIAEEQYGLTALIDTATDPEYKDEYCCAAFVTSKLAAENPAAAAAFTRAVQKASQWAQENPDETAKIIVDKQYISGDVDFCAQILKTYNYKPSVQGGYDALKQNAQELTEIGILKEGTDATKFADNAYMFFDDVPDAPEASSESGTTASAGTAAASAVNFSDAAAAEEEDCCGGKVEKPVTTTKA